MKPHRISVFHSVFAAFFLAGIGGSALAAEPAKQEPQPPVVDPGPVGGPPADAVVLFNGKDLRHFRGQRSDEPRWKLENGVMETTQTGGIFSREEFGDCQLHVEWASPSSARGNGQAHGNSGVYLMGRYEIQVLDSYEKHAEPKRQAGAFYGHSAPLVNVCRKPGEWQAYDIIFIAPRFAHDGTVLRPATVTVFHNGVLVQNHVELGGSTVFIGPPSYQPHGAKEPLMLQDHGNPVSFRNIWVRELDRQ